MRCAEFRMQPIGGARFLIAEHQAIARGIIDRPKRFLGVGREKPQPLRRRRTSLKSRPIRVLMHIERMPIIHAGAFEIFIGDRKTQRMNQVQATTTHRAQAPNVPRVRGNLRIKKHHVNHDRA